MRLAGMREGVCVDFMHAARRLDCGVDARPVTANCGGFAGCRKPGEVLWSFNFLRKHLLIVIPRFDVMRYPLQRI